MAFDNVGSIEYDARINTSRLKRDSAEADNIAKKTGQNIGDELERGESRGSLALDKLGRAAKFAAVAGGVALAGGIAAAAKAAFSQVDAVQQATIALSAYERDGTKVSAVLKDLVGYARSDLGVLFNRKDLFQAAQNLKLYGDNTADLTDHVKIMSRSVGLGLSTWDGLNNVIGRVGSTGRLYADDLQYLQNAGFKLDSSLSGSQQTFQSLFKLLDAGIPADALNGQADTIQGRFIKLQTAFRDVGNSILGVDRDTNKFIQGGLGDRFVNGITSATNFLKSLAVAFRQTIPEIRQIVSAVIEFLGPSFEALWNTISTRLLPTIERLMPFLTILAQVIGVLIVASIWVWINALNILISVLSWVGQVLSNVASWFIDRWRNIASVWSQAGGFFRGIGQAVADAFAAVKEAIIRPFREAYEAVKHILNNITDAVNDVKDKAGSIAGGVGGGASRVGSWINPFRAAGGPVSAGQPYIVGENRPELFVPRSSGTILPEVPMGSSSSNVTVNLNMSGIMARSTSDLRDVGKDILRAINQELTAKGQPAIGGIR